MKYKTIALFPLLAIGMGMQAQNLKLTADNIDDIVVERYPEIRNILYDYIMENGSIDPEVIGDTRVIGSWSFVPEKMASKAMEKDMALLFSR